MRIDLVFTDRSTGKTAAIAVEDIKWEDLEEPGFSENTMPAVIGTYEAIAGTDLPPAGMDLDLYDRTTHQRHVALCDVHRGTLIDEPVVMCTARAAYARATGTI